MGFPVNLSGVAIILNFFGIYPEKCLNTPLIALTEGYRRLKRIYKDVPGYARIRIFSLRILQ